eukprot:364003-Chlamydomonas_euryale.AAC.3
MRAKVGTPACSATLFQSHARCPPSVHPTDGSENVNVILRRLFSSTLWPLIGADILYKSQSRSLALGWRYNRVCRPCSYNPKACSTTPPRGRVKHVEACGLSEMVTSLSKVHTEFSTKLSVNLR